LEKAEYRLSIAVLNPDPQTELSEQDWQEWITRILSSAEFWTEQTTKSGKKHQVNLRDRLFDLSLIPPDWNTDTRQNSPVKAPEFALRYIGSCRNDGTLLRPEHVVLMLEQVSQQTLQLTRIHRAQLLLSSSPQENS
jgi:uncharacterized protein (DUF2344 family)